MRRTAYVLTLAGILAAGSGAQLKPGGRGIYREGWTDFNKNGRKDVYEDPKADTLRVDAAVERTLGREVAPVALRVRLDGVGDVFQPARAAA